MEGISGWPSTSMWGGVVYMLDAGGPLREYGNVCPEIAGCLMCLLEELHIAHCSKEGNIAGGQ